MTPTTIRPTTIVVHRDQMVADAWAAGRRLGEDEYVWCATPAIATAWSAKWEACGLPRPEIRLATTAQVAAMVREAA